MLKLIRTNSKNSDFVTLVKQLDTFLKQIDGDDHDFYKQFNGIETLDNTIVAYYNDYPVACGAFKKFNDNSVEIKRMFTSLEYRGKQVATGILKELETWAKEIGYTSCVLETGKRQVAAVKFYNKNGYQEIPNFGQYIGVSNSVCFEKELK